MLPISGTRTPDRAVAASLTVVSQFSSVGQIGTPQGFIFFVAWYRVVLGVQYKNTSEWVRGFRGEIGEEAGISVVALSTPKGPRRAAVLLFDFRLSTAEPLCGHRKAFGRRPQAAKPEVVV